MADFYTRAALAMQEVLSRRGSIKGITSKNENVNDAKRVMALVVNTLSFKEALQHVLDQVEISKKEAKWFGKQAPINRSQGASSSIAASDCLLMVLAHDLLLTPRGIQAAKAWPPKERIEKYKSQLHATLVRLQIRRGKTSLEGLRSGEKERKIASRIPRWCRVNTLKMSEVDVVQQLAKEGFTLTENDILDAEYVFSFADDKTPVFTLKACALCACFPPARYVQVDAHTAFHDRCAYFSRSCQLFSGRSPESLALGC